MADATDIVTRFVATPDLSTVTEDELIATIGSLEAASQSADPSLQPFIAAQIAPLEQLLKAMQEGTNSNVDFTDFKASALELLNQCRDSLL